MQDIDDRRQTTDVTIHMVEKNKISIDKDSWNKALSSVVCRPSSFLKTIMHDHLQHYDAGNVGHS